MDGVKKQDPAEPKPLNSGLDQKYAEFEGLHSGEGFMIFSVDADPTRHEPSIAILASSGADKKLQSLAQPKSKSLGYFLTSCSDERSLFRWDQDHQFWSKVGEHLVSTQQYLDTDFVELGQCIKQGELQYGILMSISANDINSERLVTLHSTGFSMLSEYSGQGKSNEKSDDKKPQERSILTAGERRVMLWCGNGKTSFEISRILGLSEHTVNHYIASAVRKLDATNRTHAIAKALKMNIVDVSEIN